MKCLLRSQIARKYPIVRMLLPFLVFLQLSQTQAHKESIRKSLLRDLEALPPSSESDLALFTDATLPSNQLFSVTGYPDPGYIPLLNRKIFRGRRVNVQEHPYVVSIRRNYSHYLTGSLIQPDLVVTVAHPIKRVPIHELGVVAGQTYNDRGTTLLTVILIFIPATFNNFTLVDDIALLKNNENIQENFAYQGNMKPIPIFKNFELRESEKAFVTGWGRCDFTGQELCLPRSSAYYPEEVMDSMLMSITIRVRTNNMYCKLGYETLELNLEKGMLCAGQAREGDETAACLAVPGAPLVARGLLLGVASWGFGCGYLNDLPLVYTDLRIYTDWIKTIQSRLKKLSYANLTHLYDATTAYKYSSFLSASRVKSKMTHRRYEELEPLGADYILSQIKNTKIYDIRNFVDNGFFDKKKRKMYEDLMLLHNVKKQRYTDIDLNDTRVEHSEL